MLLILEAIGIVAFAFVGAAEAVRSRLDVFGVVVAGTITAIGGGIMRDLLLGVHPPVGLLTWWYMVACVCTASVVFICHSQLTRLRPAIQFADAIGLGMFAVTGASRAVEHGAPFYAAAVIGMVGGIGGGIVVDVLLGRIPKVLRKEVYALPALGGGLLMALGSIAHLPPIPLKLVVVALVVSVRMVAVRLDWNLPVGSREPKPAAHGEVGLPEVRPVPLGTVPLTANERTVELPTIRTSSLPPAVRTARHYADGTRRSRERQSYLDRPDFLPTRSNGKPTGGGRDRNAQYLGRSRDNLP